MALLTKPQARIALGWSVIQGERLPVIIDIEWDRFLSLLTDRVGGVLGLGTGDIEAGTIVWAGVPVSEAQFADVVQWAQSADAQFVDVVQVAGAADALMDVYQSGVADSLAEMTFQR